MRRAFPDEVLRRRLSTVWSDALGEGDAVDLGPRTFTIRCADGTDREIDMRIFGPGSGRFYVMAEDLSERIRAERERQELELRMQQAQKLESLGVLAGGIAHDFNNLLVGILGYADLARSRMPDSEPNAHLLDQIQTAGRRLSELTAQLLAYSGKGQFVVKAVDLGALVREMAHLLEVSLSKRAHLHYEFTPALPAVSADATQLRQVVMNLITNASDALGDAEGTIHLRTGRAAVDEALLAGAVLDEGVRPGEYVYLEVEDSGPGMDAETAARIFDPFYTTKFAGRGLGLASVLGIVRGHGGTIVVDSRPGEGTRVRVLLPVAVGAAAEDTPQMDAPVAAVGGTVLVVDDDATVRDVAGAMLRQAGYEVVEAADARQALQRFDEARPAVVLLDLTMPENDGQHPYDALRARDPDVPIVLCSGYGEQVATERFAEREDTVFLPKPFVVSALLRALEEAMGG